MAEKQSDDVEIVVYDEWGAVLLRLSVTPDIAKAISALKVVFDRLDVKERG